MTPTPSEEVNVIQERSQKLFAGTLTILGLLFGGGLLSLLTARTPDKNVIILYAAAVVMGVVAGVAGMAAINWESMSARTLALYRIQIAALVSLFACLLGVATFVVLAGFERTVPIAANINPIDATASDTAPAQPNLSGKKVFTYPPERAIDDVNKTAWRVPNTGKVEWIQVNYAKPVKVSQVGIIPGHDKIDTSDLSAGTLDRFFQLYVVRQAKMEFSDGTAVEKNYERDRSMQWKYLNSPKTTKSVRIEIQDTYPPDPPYPQDWIAISEIEVR